MLKLSKKADYGLIAAGHLATFTAAGSCSAKEIAKAYNIPRSSSPRVFSNW